MKLRSIWDCEPVVVADFVKSALLLAVAFGVKLSPEQIATVLTFTVASLALAAVVRNKVSPTATAASNKNELT